MELYYEFLNGNLQLLYASRGVDTLSKVKGSFIKWYNFQISYHIETCLKETMVNKKIGEDVANRYKHTLCEAPGTCLIMRQVRLLDRGL